MSLSSSELKRLSKTLLEDPDAAYQMDQEEVNQVRRYMNQYGTKVDSKKSFINISLINWRDEYLRQLHMTGMVGYLYRTLQEYKPEEQIDRAEARYRRDVEKVKASHAAEVEAVKKTADDARSALISSPEPTAEELAGGALRKEDKFTVIEDTLKKSLKSAEESRDKSIADLRAQTDEYIKRLTESAKTVARGFLDRNFNYNPDRHLRGSHSDPPKNPDGSNGDPERKTKEQLLKEKLAVSQRAPLVEKKIRENPEATYSYVRQQVLSGYQSLASATETLKAVIKTLNNPDLDSEDKQGILYKKWKELSDMSADMKQLAEPLATSEVIPAIETDPPRDVFYHLQRYMTNHWEQLKEVTTSLYNIKADWEYAAIYYDHFKTPEAAREHRLMNQDLFKAEVLTLEPGPCLIGPFKENRERVDYYNKHTEILKRMGEQMEQDHKLGKDLVDKQVKKQKAKNIAEAGPDAPGLTSVYLKNAGSAVADAGGKKVLTREDMEKMEKEQREKEMQDVPEDTIQVDFFAPKTNDDGELVELSKGKFFTQAEAPLHMQEGSEYADKYQPKRAPGEPMQFKTKTIIAKDGTKREIKVLAKDDNSTVREGEDAPKSKGKKKHK